ncbi:MAG: PEP-CTERM sorting domain-containing protein [Sphingomonadaceae bacterium]|nr:PEP-CTERM sorting domain-containing protein [Sphingomonadaceae bacterium]
MRSGGRGNSSGVANLSYGFALLFDDASTAAAISQLIASGWGGYGFGIDVFGNGFLRASGTVTSSARLDGGLGPSSFTRACIGGPVASQCGAFTFTSGAALRSTANPFYFSGRINLSISELFSPTARGHGSGWLDPTISLDPRFGIAASHYQLLLSPNAANGSGVINPYSPTPEPATWALMVAGFGFVGAALRRRPVPA